MLVLAHHAALACHPFAPPVPSSLAGESRWWMAFPVVDSQRWSGFGLFVGFNDIFFMSLMFFLSGLFVWKSFERKGRARFLGGRALRLGLPFIVAAAVVAPLAYYPTYLLTAAPASLGGFWREWRALGSWPAGPAWFVWVLLAFDGIAVALGALIPEWGEALGRRLSGGLCRPITFFALLVAVSALAYVPLALRVTPLDWFSFGPFFFPDQPAPSLPGVFPDGDRRRGLRPRPRTSRGARKPWLGVGSLWCMMALVAFGAAAAIAFASFSAKSLLPVWGTIGGISFVVSCAASSFAFLALFVRFAQRRSRMLDSLRDNAYGMYLIHYAFVSWLQYALLKATLPAIAKGVGGVPRDARAQLECDRGLAADSCGSRTDLKDEKPMLASHAGGSLGRQWPWMRLRSTLTSFLISPTDHPSTCSQQRSSH